MLERLKILISVRITTEEKKIEIGYRSESAILALLEPSKQHSRLEPCLSREWRSFDLARKPDQGTVSWRHKEIYVISDILSIFRSKCRYRWLTHAEADKRSSELRSLRSRSYIVRLQLS